MDVIETILGEESRQQVIGDARIMRVRHGAENREVGRCALSPSPDVIGIGSGCVRHWEHLLSPATDIDASPSQRRAASVSKDIQQSDRALRRHVRPMEIPITELQR